MKAFLDGLRVSQNRRGYNSFVILEPMNQLQARKWPRSRRERGDGGEVWLGGVAGKGGAQGSSKSPRKLGGYREALGSHLPFDASVLLRLYNVSESSPATH